MRRLDMSNGVSPRGRWPADLEGLYADNPAGAKTWSEVEAAMRIEAPRAISLGTT